MPMNSRIPRQFGIVTTGYLFELEEAGKCRPSNVDAGDPDPGQAFTLAGRRMVPSSQSITDDPFFEEVGGKILIRTDF